MFGAIAGAVGSMFGAASSIWNNEQNLQAQQQMNQQNLQVQQNINQQNLQQQWDMYQDQKVTNLANWNMQNAYNHAFHLNRDVVHGLEDEVKAAIGDHVFDLLTYQDYHSFCF